MPLPDTSVKFFSSAMSGAPALSGTAGTLIGVLDACFVNGFGSVTVNSLSVTDNVATATVSAGHNFSLIGNTGPVIEIAGATPAALNGQWRIATVPNTTTFTFATSGIANGTASGTITAKRAAAGWEKRYSGANKAAYARLDPAATAMLLRVDDTPAQYPVLNMYEAMTGIDAGTGDAGTGYTAKSGSAGATNRQWAILADRLFVMTFLNSYSEDYSRSGFYFGDVIRYSSADAFACVCGLHQAASINFHPLYSQDSSSKLSRSYTGLGSAVVFRCRSFEPNPSTLGNNGPPSASLVDNTRRVWPVEVWEGNTAAIGARGVLPGVWNPAFSVAALSDNLVMENVSGLNGRTLMLKKFGYPGSGGFFDITGPWR